MGAERYFLNIWIMFCAAAFLLQSQHVEPSQDHSLDSFLHDYALDTINKPRTGKLYEVPPPANFSGSGVSLLRLRTHSLWKNGANLSSFTIPSMALPSPFTRRVDLVYQNLGNWSTHYYNVPSYKFLAPVIGLLAYDVGSTGLEKSLVELDLKGDMNFPIMVRFGNISFHQYDVKRIWCVRFAADGAWELSNLTRGGACIARNVGHFSVVVPTERKVAAVRWWVAGISAAAAVGVVVVVGFLCRWRSVRAMEKMSEKSEGLNSIWIGNSRMPCASGIRTQPNLENSYIP